MRQWCAAGVILALDFDHAQIRQILAPDLAGRGRTPAGRRVEDCQDRLPAMRRDLSLRRPRAEALSALSVCSRGAGS